MKRLLFFIVFAMSGIASQAQDQSRDRDQLREHLLYEDGTLYQMRDQDRDQVRDRIILNDGTVVNPDGSYQTRTGRQLQLRNGQCLDMEGNMYRNQNQFSRQVETRLQASIQEHLMYENGQVYRVTNNEQQAIQQQLRFRNGMAVNPDGTYYDKNGKMRQLRSGECLDMDGQRYRSQDQFRQRTWARLQERSENRKSPEGQKERMQSREKTFRGAEKPQGNQRRRGS